ncbi:MAG: SDR family NAD(P)-dependent oxidoreductase [Alphaproteobacteria bacterium]|nr:SDR family NAD(P)-dependent oxidoreductase [Alphaproteobacteria bacterium]
MSDTPTLFCFGLGYTASALCQRLRAKGWTIRGTSRSDETCAGLVNQGIAAWVFDRDHPLKDRATAFAGVTHILSSVPPDADGDPVIDLHGRDIAARSASLKWVGYLSTTGVYGDRGGGEVDETSERRPATIRGERRVAAEDGWCGLWRDNGVPTHLFRLAGIYGPGRNALETVQRGQARRVFKPGQMFSRIHLDDITQVLEASIAHPNPGTAYNLSDDEAAPPQDVTAYACELLGVEPPPEVPFEEAEMTDMARSFYAENKRVSNARIKHELGISLTYPDYRSGLRALLKADRG